MAKATELGYLKDNTRISSKRNKGGKVKSKSKQGFTVDNKGNIIGTTTIYKTKQKSITRK